MYVSKTCIADDDVLEQIIVRHHYKQRRGNEEREKRWGCNVNYAMEEDDDWSKFERGIWNLFYFFIFLFYFFLWVERTRYVKTAPPAPAPARKADGNLVLQWAFLLFISFFVVRFWIFLLGRFSTLWGPICSLRVQPLPSFHYNHYFIFKLTPVCSSKIGIINSFVMFVW